MLASKILSIEKTKDQLCFSGYQNQNWYGLFYLILFILFYFILFVELVLYSCFEKCYRHTNRQQCLYKLLCNLKIVDPNKMWVHRNFGIKNNSDPKQLWAKKNLHPKQFFVQKLNCGCGYLQSLVKIVLITAEIFLTWRNVERTNVT